MVFTPGCRFQPLVSEYSLRAPLYTLDNYFFPALVRSQDPYPSMGEVLQVSIYLGRMIHNYHKVRKVAR